MENARRRTWDWEISSEIIIAVKNQIESNRSFLIGNVSKIGDFTRDWKNRITCSEFLFFEN